METVNKLVRIEINVNGYEKHSNILVTKIPKALEEYAFEFACTLEGHNELEADGSGCIDDGGCEFIYAPCDAKTVSDDDLEILSKYMYAHEFDEKELYNIVGFTMED